MLQSNKEFERKQLEAKTVEELRNICKECGISYYEKGKRLNKKPMIDKIMDATIETTNNNEIINNDIPDIESEKERLERKKKYIEQANIGTIVAFKLPNGKVISAAITKKSTKGQKFMVETKYGAEYKISFDDVLWVKTSKRWPKGVYLLFKQNCTMEVTEDGKEIN